MEEALAAIRQAMTDEEVGEITLAPAEPRTFREQAGAKPTPEGGLLSREATAAVGSAFNTLTETVKKHEPTLDDVVRETLRPMLSHGWTKICPASSSGWCRKKSNGSLADADYHSCRTRASVGLNSPRHRQEPHEASGLTGCPGAASDARFTVTAGML